MLIDAKVICFREERRIVFPSYLFSIRFPNLKEATERIKKMLRSDFGRHYDKAWCFLGKKGKRKKIKIRIKHVCQR